MGGVKYFNLMVLREPSSILFLQMSMISAPFLAMRLEKRTKGMTREELMEVRGKTASLPVETRMAEFVKIAASFGPADPVTKKFREQCKERGFSVVFRSGRISRENTIEILKSSEATRMLAAR